MLFSILSAGVFASLTVAQYASLPSCAQDCATSQFSGGSYGDCGTDPKCICADPDFIGTISCCLIDACDAADQQAAISFAQQMCAANGVTVQSTASCATATAAATGASSSGGSSSSGSSSASSSSSSATGTGSAAATSAAPTGTPAAGTAASSAASAAWAPKQTAAMGVEFLGGLAAVAGLAFL